MKYLIDGYNLIFECGLHGREITGHSVALARTKLLRTITTHLPDSDHASVTVVFDASRRMVREELDREEFGEVQVLYSINFDEADDMIEHLIKKHSVPTRLTVVSSDHRIHKAALRRKAQPIDSDQWYEALIGGRLKEPVQESADNDPPRQALLTDEELEQMKRDLDDLGI